MKGREKLRQGLLDGKMIHNKGNEQLSVNQIHNFLCIVDNEFPVALSEKTDLKEFALKLYHNATICIYEEDGVIKAMVAGYTQNTINRTAYMTMAVALPEYRGKGIVKELVLEFIERAKLEQLVAVHLYAVRENVAAMKLYESIGFVEWYLENEPRPDDVHFVYYLQQKTALVTAIGSYAADIVIKNLKKIGFKVIGSDIYDREWVADAYNVNEFYQVPRVADKEEYLKAVDYISETENITHILPLTDIEVDFFNEHRKHYEEKNITVCIASTYTLAICRNKKTQQEFIDKNVPSVRTIPTINISECKSVPFDFPMVCKPYDGRSSQGLKYIYTIEEWLAAKAMADVDKYVVQPFIKGRIVTVDIIRQREEKTVVAIPRLEFLRTLNGAGTSVKVFPDRDLGKMCMELADAYDVVGCVNFEFLKSESGEYHYVECNPRFSGGVEFSCLAGYDCVGNHIRCFENKKIDKFKLERKYFIARKFEEYVTKVI